MGGGWIEGELEEQVDNWFEKVEERERVVRSGWDEDEDKFVGVVEVGCGIPGCGEVKGVKFVVKKGKAPGSTVGVEEKQSWFYHAIGIELTRLVDGFSQSNVVFGCCEGHETLLKMAGGADDG